MRRLWDSRAVRASIDGEELKGPTLRRHLRRWREGRGSPSLRVFVEDAAPRVPLTDPRQVVWGPSWAELPPRAGPAPDGFTVVPVLVPESLADVLRRRAALEGLSTPELLRRLVEALERPQRARTTGLASPSLAFHLPPPSLDRAGPAVVIRARGADGSFCRLAPSHRHPPVRLRHRAR